MKKIGLLTAALALLCAVAFADQAVKVAGWGRGFAVPLANNGEETVGFMSSGKGENYIRNRITISGAAKAVGFQVDLNSKDFSSPGIDDQAKIWAKPFDTLTLTVGKFKDSKLRGNMAFGMYNWLRTGAGALGEDLTFTRIDKTGLGLALTPIDGLYINAGIPLPASTISGVEDVYKSVQAGAGFTIGGIGTIKAQFIGVNYTTDDGTYIGDVEAAFDLQAIDAVFITLGGKIRIGDGGAVAAKNTGHTIAAGARAKLGMFTLYGLCQAVFADDVGIGAGLGADAAISDNLTIIADVRYQNDAGALSQSQSFAFLAGVEKALGNGKIGIGFQGATGGVGFKDMKASEDEDASEFCFAVPIKFEYSF